MGGVDITMKMLPVLDASGVMPNAPEMMNEAWGLLGYKDAGRFFKNKPDQSGKPPPPEVMKEQIGVEKAKVDLEKSKIDLGKAQEDRQFAAQDRAAQNQERIAMQEGEANAKRQEAGLPGDAMWAQLAAAVSHRLSRPRLPPSSRPDQRLADAAARPSAAGSNRWRKPLTPWPRPRPHRRRSPPPRANFHSEDRLNERHLQRRGQD